MKKPSKTHLLIAAWLGFCQGYTMGDMLFNYILMKCLFVTTPNEETETIQGLTEIGVKVGLGIVSAIGGGLLVYRYQRNNHQEQTEGTLFTQQYHSIN